MSFFHAAMLAGASGNQGPYQIEQSLRFDGSHYLTRTPSSAGNRKTWTMSMWVKYADDTTNRRGFFGMNTGASNSRYVQWFIHNNDLKFAAYDSTYRRSDAAYRDYSGWYHLVLRSDTTQSSEPDRLRIYVNGELITARNPDQTTTDVSQDHEWGVNYTDKHWIGTSGGTSEYLFKGYIAEFHLVDGSSLAPTNFGEFDDNNVWRPIQASVSSYGTNGVYLKFDPGATNGIGHDHSGNGNNFTPTGFTTSGTGTDVMSDTPTTNYATWNPLDNTGVTLANGNLDFSGGSSNDCGGTFAVASGKWYWEIECRTDIGPGGQPLAHGIHNASVTSDFRLQAVWFYTDASSNSQVRRYANNSNVAQVSMPASIRDIDIGDILQVAYDADSGEVWFGVDNTWMDGSGGTTGNPGSGSNPVFTLPDASIPMTPWRSHAGLNWDGYTNFGQRDFAYTPPTGFNALNTANLPAPTVKDGSDYFQTVTYSGTGATRDITVADNTDNAWQPDLVWIKNRDITDHHAWFDSVRGVLNYISSNRTNVEAALANSLTSFNSDGFTLDSANLTNYLNQAYVSWNWLAANGTEVLDAGSINSTVSANPTAGFSIVNWTVGSTDNQTVAHGLGVPPDLIITKNRDTGYGWATYHSPLGATKYLTLDTSNTPVTNSIAWNNTEPTSTVFTVGDASWWGSSTDSMIAYCFAEVENYSKFGSYTGNGSLDGPFVYCGFRPAWVIIKRTDGTGEWFMVDTSRNPYNPSDQDLFADSDTKETSSSGKDLLSNGFKIRESGASMNASGGSFIFMAFSEHPFGGSGVSPATAR